MLDNAKKAIASLTEIGVALLALAIVASLLVGASNMAFFGGVELLKLLVEILEGQRAFEGLHGITGREKFKRYASKLYADPYHNYFFLDSKTSFKLCLHTDFQPLAEVVAARTDKELMSHLWFGSQSDPVERISAAMAAKLLAKAELAELSDDEDDDDVRSICQATLRKSVVGSELLSYLDTTRKRQILQEELHQMFKDHPVTKEEAEPSAKRAKA